MVDQSTAAARRPGMAQRRALVSGASFAGLATAFWLTRLGYKVTLVEIAKGLRRGGTPVDIAGETIAILDRMGLLKAVMAKVLPPRAFAFKDADNVTLGTLDQDTASETEPAPRYEIHRDDLLEILFRATEGSVETLFGRSIARLEDGADGVAVTFDDSSVGDFALVCGCDGNRSKTRRLVFGDAETSSYFMGGYVYLKVVPQIGLLAANHTEVFSVPGRTAMLNGYHDRTDIAFAFRTEGQIDYDYRDRAQQRRLVHAHFDGIGWKVPEMLAQVDDDNPFYFDRLSQIRMQAWAKGHVVLVGDAGYCVSPVAGMGGSMAIIGAGRLADALRRHPDDQGAAFRAYEDGLRPFVEDVQNRAATLGMSLMFPGDEHELAARDQKIRAGEIEL